MSNSADADAVFAAFLAALESVIAVDGARLERTYSGHTDRAFAVSYAGRQLNVVAKVSQSDNGFWGLTDARARELVAEQGFLLLLHGIDSGYFISPKVFARLLPKFSRTEKDNAVRINEGVVRAEARFRDLDELWEHLEPRFGPAAV